MNDYERNFLTTVLALIVCGFLFGCVSSKDYIQGWRDGYAKCKGHNYYEGVGNGRR